MKCVIAFLFVACTMLVPPNDVNASGLSFLLQEDGKLVDGGMQEEDGTVRSEDVERLRTVVLEVKRQAFLGQLMMQIDRLEKLLKLKESQVKKLSIAAKAVSGRRKEKWATLMDDYEMWEEMGQSVAANLDELEKADLSDFSKLPAQLLFYMDDSETLGIVAPDLFRDKFWVKSLNSVLDEHQAMIYEEDLAKRNDKVLGSLIDYVTQNFVRELLLTEETALAVEKFVKSELEKNPIRPEFLSMYSEVINLVMSRLSLADLDELKTVLSNNQLNRLRTMLAAYGPDGFMFVEEADFELEENEVEEAEADDEEMDDE